MTRENCRKSFFFALVGLSLSGCVCDSPARKSSSPGISTVTQEQRFALLDRAVGETNVAELNQLVIDPALRAEVKASGYDLLITAINNRSYETVKISLDSYRRLPIRG